jgi:signal peptidase I
MNFDFATVLVILVAVSGLIVLYDRIILSSRRKAQGLDTRSHKERETPERPPLLVEYARSFLPIFLIVLVLRSFLVEPFRIPSGSMMPTLLIGDFILVNKFTYGIRLPVINTKVFDLGSPKRGDVIVFRYPEDPSTPFIKRVVGLPGDRVAYYDKTLWLNGRPVAQTPVGEYIGVGAGVNMTGALLRHEQLTEVEHSILLQPSEDLQRIETVIPKGHYFVLGDNRDNSKDSRYWGTVPDENLIGKAFMIWMNWDNKNGGIDWSRIGNLIH